MDNIKKEDESIEDIIKTEEHFHYDIKEEKYINFEDAFNDKETCNDKSWIIDEERNDYLEQKTTEKLTKDWNISNHICVNYCSAYSNEGSLLAHMQSCQFELKNDLFPTTEKKFISPIKINQLLMTGGNVIFSNYQRTVQQKTKPFNCTECDFKFSESSDLTEHINAVHKKKKSFNCIECNYKCSSKSRLSIHIRAVHKKEKPFQCSECDYKCTEKSSLPKHIMTVHKKEKPFQCSECDYKCCANSRLSIHIRAVHKKEKPFNCSECAYKCSEKGTLARHIRSVHKKEKPFQCSECDYKCTEKSSLPKHIKRVHKKEKPFI